jgi:hypothetical protein
MDDFDWVTELSRCSPVVVFEKLKLQIREDVKIRNSQLPKAHDPFRIEEHGSSFAVLLPSPHQAVTFSVTDKKISVKDWKGKLICEATLTLNDEGECKVKIKGKERELWQMRKMALEELFFEG